MKTVRVNFGTYMYYPTDYVPRGKEVVRYLASTYNTWLLMWCLGVAAPQHGRLMLMITSIALWSSQESQRVTHTSIVTHDIAIVEFLPHH
jgi:hypothetical protein